MPELPEVETVVRGLRPLIAGARIDRVTLHRPNLRFPLPEGLEQRLSGLTLTGIVRRAKYLIFETSDPHLSLLAHLGMTGNFRFGHPDEDGTFEKHDHVVFTLNGPSAPTPFLIYSDPRRFGFLDLFDPDTGSPFLLGLGPEPLGNDFSAQILEQRFAQKRTPIKSALLDQHVVAGLGNIYVCEALFRSGLAPDQSVGALDADQLNQLVGHIRDVLTEAIVSGGSTLQDYRQVDGSAGYFQHHFSVYGREGAPCERPTCSGVIARRVQAGRSTFYCPACQTG